MFNRAKTQQILLIGFFVLIACLISIFFLDQKIAHILTAEQALLIYQPARKLTDVGEGDHFFAFAILGYLVSLLFIKYKKWKGIEKNFEHLEKAKTWFLTFFLALLSSGVVLQILKFLVGRQRPHLTEDRDPLVFEYFTSHWHMHSFPSGHTQTVFTVAMALGLTFPRGRWWFFVLAGLIASTRVLLQEHFFSDLLMGAYIGCAVTWLVFSWRQKR